MLSFRRYINSQAPDVPELGHQGVFQLSRLSINCYVKTTKKCSLYLSRTDFLKILSVPQDHCGSHNNLMKFFSKNYTLYGVYIFSNFGFRLNRLAFNDTKKTFLYIRSCSKIKRITFFGSNVINLSANLIE